MDPAMQPYERRLATDKRWGLSEGSRHFEGHSAVQDALREIARRLDELGIPYAVAGGMALFLHGHRRFTEDIDILVTRDGLRMVHRELEGRGYVRPFPGSKQLRDAARGVRIEFLVAGDYPGDGKPKPIAFPDPRTVAERHDGIAYVDRRTLVELKLASGMTDPGRTQDLADVQALIRNVPLGREFADVLDPFVRDAYLALWDATRARPRRYLRLWPKKLSPPGVTSIKDLAAALRCAAEELEAMHADGVTLDPEGSLSGDYVRLVTVDPDVARKYEMHEEGEFLDEDPGR